jgi:hypothetical protein
MGSGYFRWRKLEGRAIDQASFRRPSEGWGPSRLSTKHCAILIGAIGTSLRWCDGVFKWLGENQKCKS